MRATCSLCRYFEREAYPLNERAGGLCRRRAPVVRRHYSQQGWPEVQATDWCGQFSVVVPGIPAGVYRAEIIEAYVEPAISGCRLQLDWQVTEGTYRGERVLQSFSLPTDSVPFAEIRHATGKICVNDSTELVGIPCHITVGKRRGQPDSAPMEIISVTAVRP